MSESDWDTMEAALITPNAIGQRGRDEALAALSRRREEAERQRVAVQVRNEEIVKLQVELVRGDVTAARLEAELTSLRKQLEELAKEMFEQREADLSVDDETARTRARVWGFAIDELSAILNPEQETP